MKYIFGGKNYYIAMHIDIFPPIQVRGKMAMGKTWLYNTGINKTIKTTEPRGYFW
jgi:hypothetical protein